MPFGTKKKLDNSTQQTSAAFGQGFQQAAEKNPAMSAYVTKKVEQAPAPQMGVQAQPQQSYTAVQAPAPQAQTQTAPQTPAPKVGEPGHSLQEQGYITESGKLAADHVTSNAQNLGQDPGQISEAGQLYAQRTTDALKGNNPLVTNAQQTEDTAAARREYQSRKATQEGLAQSPFAAGSAQYQRAMDRSQAGVSRANQEGQAGVNAFTRQTTEDAMNRAGQLETQQYNRNQTNLSQAQGLEDQQYGRAIGERTNTQMQSTQLSNSIKDPKAKYAFDRAVASGASPQEAYKSIVGDSGSINSIYQSADPATMDVEGNRKSAEAWIKATTGMDEDHPEFQNEVVKRMKTIDETKRGPMTDADLERKNRELTGMIVAGEELSPENEEKAVKTGVIPTVNHSSIPTGNEVASFMENNPSGKFALGGTVYTMVKGSNVRTGNTKHGDPRHTSVAEVKDKAGNTKYFYDGKINDKPPQQVGSVSKSGKTLRRINPLNW